jgi:hypothetical protein
VRFAFDDAADAALGADSASMPKPENAAIQQIVIAVRARTTPPGLPERAPYAKSGFEAKRRTFLPAAR